MLTILKQILAVLQEMLALQKTQNANIVSLTVLLDEELTELNSTVQEIEDKLFPKIVAITIKPGVPKAKA